MAGGRVTKRMRRQKCDIISSLPDAILCHILSFLPTKYSVRTRLLSTRWKYLFTFVPVLDFDNHTGCGFFIYDHQRETFIDFVNKMLMMYNTHQMTKFRLVSNYSTLKHLDSVVSWIWFAIYRNVQELDISVFLSLSRNDLLSVPSQDFFQIRKRLPLDLFSCEKLSVLKLDGPFEIKLLNRAFLPSLKTLHLGHISDVGQILSICPPLEDLSVDTCGVGKVLDISQPILRKLRINNLNSYSGCDDFELVLNAPNLVCFEYLSSDIIKFCGVSVMMSLVKAEISSEVYCMYDIAKLVTLVSHARHLSLSLSVINELSGSVKKLPTFHNLTCLEVGEASSLVVEVFPEILNKCSVLEVLVFTQGFYDVKPGDLDDPDDEDSEVDMKRYENVPSCVSVHLKEVEFREFRGLETEWKLVEYFLRNAKDLKKMKIQSRFSWKKRFTKKLLAFPRFSRECQIVIGKKGGKNRRLE